MTQDLLYYESGYVDSNYFVYTADAESAISAQASMTITVGVIKESSASLEVTATVTATISHIEGADLFAFTEASLSAEVSRIRDNNIAVSGVFDAAIDASRIRHVSADDFSTATVLVGNNLRVRFSEAAVDAAFSLTADATMIPGGDTIEADAALSAVFDIEANASKQTDIIDLSVNSEFTQSATANMFAGLDALLEVNASQNTINSRTRDVSSAIESTSSLSGALDGTLEANASLSSTSSLSATISHIEGADLQAFTNASLSASADRTRSTSVAVTSTASVSATALRIQESSSALSSAFAVTAVIGSIKEFNPALSSEFTQVTTGNIGSKRPRVVDFTSGTPSFDSSTKLVGTHSLLIPTSSSVRYSSSKDYLIHAGEDFIIELFFRPTTLNSGATLVRAGTAGVSTWAINFSSGAPRFEWTVGSSTYAMVSSSTVSTNNWHYVKVTKVGTTMYMHKASQSAGVWGSVSQVATSSDNGLNASGQVLTNAVPLIFNNSGTNYAGYYDEFYFARGTTSGGQDTSALGSRLVSGKESTTVALFHFDNNYDDDMTGTAFASASLSAVASITAQPDDRVRVASASLSSNGFVVAAVGRIQPETAALDSQFVLNASVDKIKYGSADLSSQFELTANALDLDITSAQLSASSTLTISALANKKASAGLTATSSIVARPDRTYLQLFGGYVVPPDPHIHNSGYITGTGATLELATQNGTTYGIAPVTINFWFQLPDYNTMPSTWGYELYSDMTDTSQNVAIELHSDGTDRWVYIQGIVDSGGTPRPFSKNYYIPSDVDLSQWTNFHGSLLPTISQTTSQLTATFETAYINGTQVAAQETVVLHSGSGSPPVLYTTGNTPLDAGLWGDPDNEYTINLDSIWIKQNSTAPINNFIVNGEEAFITNNGTTLSGQRAQVWLPFGSLTDQSSLSPTWNYTAVNHVLYRMIKLASGSLSSAFTQATSIDRVRPAVGTWDSQFQQSTTALRLRNPGAKNLAVTASLSETTSRIRPGSASLSSAFTQTSNAIKTAQGALSAQMTATMSVSAVKYRPGSSSVLVDTTQVTNAVKTTSITQELTAQATQTAQALRIKQLSAGLVATGSELTIAVKTGQGLIHAQMTATMQVNAIKTTEMLTQASTETSLVANAISRSEAVSELSSTSNLVLNPTYLRHTEVNLVAQASLQATATLTASARSDLTAQASLVPTTTNAKITGYNAGLEALTSITSQNQIVRLFASSMTAETEVLGTVYALVQYEADLRAEGFQLTAGRLFHIDEYYQIRIRPEDRTLSIKQETREITVLQETRVNIIKGTPAL